MAPTEDDGRIDTASADLAALALERASDPPPTPDAQDLSHSATAEAILERVTSMPIRRSLRDRLFRTPKKDVQPSA